MVRITGRVLEFSEKHRDYYVYSEDVSSWLRVWCTVDGEGCTAEETYPRGWKFSHTFQRFGKSAKQMQSRFDQSEACIKSGRWELSGSNAKHAKHAKQAKQKEDLV